MYAFKGSHWSSHGLVLRWAGPGFGRRLLDVGSGGVLVDRLREQQWKVTTLDRTGEPDVLVDLDRERPSHLGHFDTIVCADVLEHLARPEDTLRWLRGLLVTEGRLVVSLPNVAHLSVRLGLLAGQWTTQDRGLLDRTHRHFFTRATGRALVTGADLRIRKATATPAPVECVLPWWPGALQALHAGLARAWPTLWGYQCLWLTDKGAE